MREFMLTDLNRRPGELLEVAAVEPVALTRYRRVRFVLMSAERYEGLAKGGGVSGSVGTGDAQPAEAHEEADPPQTQSQLTLI